MDPVTLDPGDSRDAHIDKRLREEPIIWLGTVRPDGRPHIVPVWFLWDGETILVFSKPDQKIRNLRKNAQVVIAVDNSDGGDAPVGVEGTAELLEHGTVTTALPAYAEKYAAKLQQFGWTGESMAREYTEPIRIRPTRFLFR